MSNNKCRSIMHADRSNKGRTALPIFLIAVFGSISIHATSLRDRTIDSASKPTSIDIEVACGTKGKASCNTLQYLNTFSQDRSVQINLVELNSAGSVESIEGLCNDKIDPRVNAAIAQADAADTTVRMIGCSNKIEKVGVSIYPYYSFFSYSYRQSLQYNY